MMLGGSHAQEQKRLRNGMEQNEEDRRPYRLRHSNPRARGDKTEVRDGGVRQDALGVALGDRHERAQKERDAADEHDHDQEGGAHTSMIGESLTSRNTPAFTIVEECRSAEVGVGATIAPRSHVWKGICAALVMPANARKP